MLCWLTEVSYCKIKKNKSQEYHFFKDLFEGLLFMGGGGLFGEHIPFKIQCARLIAILG